MIIGHSQFEKIPLSIECQEAMMERQVGEIELAIGQAKANNGERYTIKQMEKTKKSLQTRLEKLNDTSRKDNVVTFEQLGVDRLFVGESHFYKNFFYTRKCGTWQALHRQKRRNLRIYIQTPDIENSKAAACVDKAFQIWGQTKEQKSTQLIFCDLSTPKGNGTFNVYEDIKSKLIG